MEYMSSMLVVRDMEVSKQFYTGLLGMHVTHDFGANVGLDGRLALQTQDSWADFMGKDVAGFRFGGDSYELYFEEENLDGFLAVLQADWPQVTLAHETKAYPWGQRAVRFYDPDGHLVEVGESMKTVVKRFILEGLSDEEAAQRSMYPLPFIQTCRNELKGEGKL